MNMMMYIVSSDVVGVIVGRAVRRHRVPNTRGLTRGTRREPPTIVHALVLPLNNLVAAAAKLMGGSGAEGFLVLDPHLRVDRIFPFLVMG